MARSLISVRGCTGKLKADCPNCMGFADDKQSRPTAFRMNDGITHVAPDIWLAGRSRRIEQEHGLGPVEASMQAMADWAWHCGIERELKGAA